MAGSMGNTATADGESMRRGALSERISGARREGGGQRLWSRDFALFFAARAVAKAGDGMLPVALSAGLLAHGFGAGGIGLAMASFSVCFVGVRSYFFLSVRGCV